ERSKAEQFQHLFRSSLRGVAPAKLNSASGDTCENSAIISLAHKQVFDAILFDCPPASMHISPGQQDNVGICEEHLILFGKVPGDHAAVGYTNTLNGRLNQG